MYSCNITAKELIEQVKSEADISLSITDESWTRWINVVEQTVYTELLREYESWQGDYESDTFSLNKIIPPSGCAVPEYDDVVRVFCDKYELERSGLNSTTVFYDKNLYSTDYAGNIILNCNFTPNVIKIVYKIRPVLKAVNSTDLIRLPVEWIDMMAAKMRGEAYKIANEDGLAGKWLADYNTQLESFKIWAAERNKRFGG